MPNYISAPLLLGLIIFQPIIFLIVDVLNFEVFE